MSSQGNLQKKSQSNHTHITIDSSGQIIHKLQFIIELKF